MLWNGYTTVQCIDSEGTRLQYRLSTRSMEQTNIMQRLQCMLRIMCRWRREPDERFDHVRKRRISSSDCLKYMSIEECRHSLRIMHLLSLNLVLRLGIWRKHLFELVRTQNSIFVSPLISRVNMDFTWITINL